MAEIEVVKWFYFECRICGYDSDEANELSRDHDGLCPLCLADCGHEHKMTYRPATEEEIKKLDHRGNYLEPS